MYAQGAQAFPAEIYFFRHDWPKVTFKLEVIGKPKPVLVLEKLRDTKTPAKFSTMKIPVEEDRVVLV